MTWADAGSPAHAGIDPCMPASSGTRYWFPRTRGDRPTAVSVYGEGNLVPPHTRG